MNVHRLCSYCFTLYISTTTISAEKTPTAPPETTDVPDYSTGRQMKRYMIRVVA
jgi:hypothetical protein